MQEKFWNLHDTPDQQKERGGLLRMVYAWIDPKGWDARRWDLANIDVASVLRGRAARRAARTHP